MPEVLGILSDSHDRVAVARGAVERLLAEGATRLVHLGDVGSDGVLDLLVGVPATVCFGNCDDDRGLARYASFLDIDVLHPSGVIEVDGTTVGLTHGHLEREVRSLLDARVHYLLHGHTHEPRDERLGATRVLNPGALHRARRFTALLLEPSTGRTAWYDISTGERLLLHEVLSDEGGFPG